MPFDSLLESAEPRADRAAEQASGLPLSLPSLSEWIAGQDDRIAQSGTCQMLISLSRSDTATVLPSGAKATETT
jgi:hypothetical protein